MAAIRVIVIGLAQMIYGSETNNKSYDIYIDHFQFYHIKNQTCQ